MTCSQFENGKCKALSAFLAQHVKDQQLITLVNQAQTPGQCPMPKLAQQMAPINSPLKDRCAASIIHEHGNIVTNFHYALISFMRMITHQDIDSLVTEREATII